MPLSAEELEQPYFIPTSENVSQILAELRAAAEVEPSPDAINNRKPSAKQQKRRTTIAVTAVQLHRFRS